MQSVTRESLLAAASVTHLVASPYLADPVLNVRPSPPTELVIRVSWRERDRGAEEAAARSSGADDLRRVAAEAQQLRVGCQG